MISKELQQHINHAKKSVSTILKRYGNSSDPKLVKKASLLSYWLIDYTRMIKKEETFNPAFAKKYKRGDIIQVHLGFNIGSEEGGLHYAVVVSNFNPATSDTLTVVPLTSKKPDTKEYRQNIDLGSTLYDQLKAKYDKAAPPKKDELNYYNDQLSTYHELLAELAQSNYNEQTNNEPLIECLAKISDITRNIHILTNELEIINKIQEEINHMKEGSIALVGQITTISKIRIYNPTKQKDSLKGIKLLPEQLDLLDAKIIELYTHK